MFCVVTEENVLCLIKDISLFNTCDREVAAGRYYNMDSRTTKQESI
jgi:hypothetical protein